ncbi:MAG: hypothetical protein A2007_02415 [Verrucomicrobia bacterium GWC2_42_7]|nr:MAG: hypothetical protein A2007_02415 [Verrucomicrobia bacterium GWC2_42_7]
MEISKNRGETAFGRPKTFPRTPSEKEEICAITISFRTCYGARRSSAKISPQNIFISPKIGFLGVSRFSLFPKNTFNNRIIKTLRFLLCDE